METNVLPKINDSQELMVDVPVGNPYIQAATRPNTRRAYQHDIQQFITWGGVLPATPDNVMQYLHDEAERLNPRTLSRRLIALRHWHRYQGFADPTAHEAIKKTLRGIQNTHGKPKEKASALTLEHLAQIALYLKQQNNLTAYRDNALLQVGFFGALRRSELVAIHAEHITWVPEGMELLIPRSKTDPTGQGQICAIPYGDEKLCAVSAVKAWCEQAGIVSGPLFCAISSHQQRSLKPLSTDSVSRIIKQLALLCQLPHPQQFSGHSLRRGFATASSKKGASFVAIMRHGRWRHERTVLEYIEEGQRFEENVVNTLMQKTTVRPHEESNNP